MKRGNKKPHRDNATFRAKDAAYHRAQTHQAQDIGPPPPCFNPARRAACLADLALFCKTYFPKIFSLPWSKDHLRRLANLDRRITEGGCSAEAAPRGDGKTQRACAAHLKAVLSGLH